MFQFPGFAFVPYVFRNKYLLLISASPNRSEENSSNSELQRSKVGFPIRKFTDQSLFAAPHDLSQRTTSFFASQRQGIHRIPLRHLIALIIDAHRSARKTCTPFWSTSQRARSYKDQFASNTPGTLRSSSPTTGCACFHAIEITSQAIGCISSLRCKITRLAEMGLKPMLASKRNCINGRTNGRCFEHRIMRSAPKSLCACSVTLVFRALRRRQDPFWWSQTGSNRRPHACKARALPTELWPLARGDKAAATRQMAANTLLQRRRLETSKWWAWEDLNFRPHAYQARALTN